MHVNSDAARARTKVLAPAAALAVVAALALAPAAAPAAERRSPHSLKAAVAAATYDRAGVTAASAAEDGRDARVRVDRRSRDGAWAFGVAVLTAPHVEGAYPDGWLFVARRDARSWDVGLEGSATFRSLAAGAPSGVVLAHERARFTRSGVKTQVIASSNTRLRLPYALGQTWTMSGGPHGWAGYDTPYSSIDLAGGDQIVRAAGSGSAYLMCKGWIRIAHSTGYSTDYYHLWDNISPASGSAISEGAYVGYTGTDITCGGAASARHVHFSLLADGARTSLYQKSFGKWVFWPGNAYGGYATHGSTIRYAGGGLYNYGRLEANQGIVDSNGGTSVNKRSGPGTGYAIVGSVADGATVTISCWRNGTSHTGRYGTTSVWDRLSDGTWVSDAFVYTGAYTIGPQC